MKRVGFIGLGTMGHHMATHLIQAGHDVIAADVVKERVDRLVAIGATRAESPKEIAERVDVVITMLPDTPDVEMVALGADGLLQGARHGLIHIDMSSIAPHASIRIADSLGSKGVRCLDAPVSGGQVGAETAMLSIMVGGPKELFEEMSPFLAKMGRTITYCGPHGAGQTVKACNQIQVALTLVGMAEALVLGAKAGVDPATILRVLGSGYAQSRVADVRGPRLIRREFAPGFMSKLHLKDLRIGLELGKELGVPLESTAVVHRLFSSAVESGDGELDHSAVIRVLERAASVEVRTDEGHLPE